MKTFLKITSATVLIISGLYLLEYVRMSLTINILINQLFN